MKVESIDEKLMRLAEVWAKIRYCRKQQAPKDKLAYFYAREAMAKVDTAIEKKEDE